MFVTLPRDRDSVLAVARLELLVADPQVAEDVPAGATLARDVGVDHGTLHELFSRLEYRYAITVPEHDRRSLATLDDVATYVVSRVGDVWGGR
jgi:hypothetical protein